MPYVTPASLNIKASFGSHFSLPYFQRDYKWDVKHFTELLNDIQSAFLLEHDFAHGRKNVASYKPYFLGSIITAAEKDGKRPLVDGQQRLTSVFVILAYLERLRRDTGVADAADIKSLLGSVSYGVMDYTIEFSATRKKLFDTYFEDGTTHADAMKKIGDIEDFDDGDLRLIDALRTTDSQLHTNVKSRLAFFIDYLIERVFLIDISVGTEAEAHQVFVTMNDRGLRLGPIELLKGKILSKIGAADDNEIAHASWTDVMAKLRKRDPEEDSLFFRTLLRAKWAKDIRGKNKGDPPGDFDLIGEAYHRWFDDHSADIGLSNADKYLQFARDDVPFYADAYMYVREAEEEYAQETAHIFYNSARKFTLQPMILLAAVDPNDSEPTWREKVSLVARYLDLVLTTRTIEGKDNNYDNLRDLSFTITKDIRGKSLAELKQYVSAGWDVAAPTLGQIDTMKYAYSERTDLLYVLARIAEYFEKGFDVQNSVGFPAYWHRDKSGKTFDIEHVFKSAFDVAALPAAHGFADAAEYSAQRNLLGALLLLPRARNRSLQDKSYSDKRAVYATEHVLAQTLCDAYYTNNPKVAAFKAANPDIKVEPIPAYTKDEIKKRGELYKAVAQKIWAKPV